jgi:hypothetical protein
MSTNPNVTTPGGFFVGLGGIVAFSVVAIVVYQWVKSPPPSEDLRPQQVALGLRPGPEVKGDEAKKKEAEAAKLLAEAARRYNAGAKPNLDNLDDLRGVVRYREAQKSKDEASKALAGAVAWKDKAKGEVTMPIDLAMKVVASGLKDRKPKPSAVKLDIFPPADPTAVPMMPNAMFGAARTVFFPDPNAVPLPDPAPAAPPATTPAPGTPAAPVPAAPEKQASPTGAAAPDEKPAATAAAPARPPLLNWPETKK